MKKPSFNVSKDCKTVEVDGTVYSLSNRKIGENIERLQTGCEEGFRPPTFSELLNLMHASHLNEDNEQAKKIIWSANNYGSLIANTITKIKESGLIVALDNPQFRENEYGNREVKINEKDLVDKLRPVVGSDLSGWVVIGRGGARVMPISELNSGVYNPFTILAEEYPILLTGDKTSPEKLAQIAERTKKDIRLVIKNTASIMTPIFGVGYMVTVGHSSWGYAGGFYTFDVRKSA